MYSLISINILAVNLYSGVLSIIHVYVFGNGSQSINRQHDLKAQKLLLHTAISHNTNTTDS